VHFSPSAQPLGIVNIIMKCFSKRYNFGVIIVMASKVTMSDSLFR